MEIGLTKRIGVSNATVEQLKRILTVSKIRPFSNHIECCPGHHQKKLIKYCRDNNILVTAYCPLSRPDFQRFSQHYNSDETVKSICRKYNKTSPQLILRYLVSIIVIILNYMLIVYLFKYQLGTIPIPKSITKQRIEHYIEIFDFELTQMEMSCIDSFYTDERLVVMENELGLKNFPICVRKVFLGNRED